MATIDPAGPADSARWYPWVLVILILLLFAEHIVRGLTCATNILEGSNQWNPFWTFARSEISRGRFPLWMPGSFEGWYFAGFAHIALFYPFALIFYLLPYETGTTWNVMVHLCLAALLMYRFLRGMKCSPFSSFVCSILWGTSGFVFSFAGFVPLLWTAAWAPLAFDAANRWADEGRLRHLAILAATVAVQALGGSVESLTYEMISLALFVLFLKPGWIRSKPGNAICLVMVLGLSALISSVQLIPSFDLTGQSLRKLGVSYGFFAQRGFPLAGWISLFAPIGLLPAKAGSDAMLTPGYMGLITVFFVLFFLFSRGGGSFPSRWRAGLPALILVVFSARDLPVVGPLLYRIPVLNLMREAIYGLFLPELFFILMAGWGVDKLRERIFRSEGEGTAVSRRTIAGIFLAGAAVCVLTAVTAGRTIIPPGRFVLAGGILIFTVAFAAVSLSRPNYLKAVAGIGLAVIALLDTWVLAWAYLPRHQRGYLDINPEYKDFFSARPPYERNVILDVAGVYTRALPPNLGALAGTQTLDGWEGMQTMRQALFLNLLDPRSLQLDNGRIKKVGYHLVFRDGGFLTPGRLPYLNLAGVKYIVSRIFPVKFSSPYSLVDAYQFFSTGKKGDLEIAWEEVSGRTAKGIELAPKSEATINYTPSAGDVLRFRISCRGRVEGNFEIRAVDSQSGAAVLYSTALADLPEYPGASVEIDLSQWKGRAVGLQFESEGEGSGKVVLVDPEVANGGSVFQRVFHGSIDIFENRAAFPRAFVVGKAAIVKDRWEAVSWLEDNASKLREEIPLEQADAETEPAGEYENLMPATIARYDPSRVELEVRPQRGGYLVLTDSYYPGWKALVDGKPSRIMPASVNFRSVAVSDGGRVEFIFEPQSFRMGLWASIASILAFIYLAAVSARKESV